MKKTFTLIFSLLVIMTAHAQERYVDPVFTGITVEADVIYGQNISVLTGAPAVTDLVMDVYTPEGDTATDKPLVLIAHTGSFLPAIVNGTQTGTRYDSTAIEVMKRLVIRGYAVGIYDYRLGWNPISMVQDVRTATLLQAAYRGIQDTRTAVRYMRKLVEEDENPYGIDPDKIGVWGIGTGGYLALGTGTLDDFSEVTLPKFRDINGDPLIVEEVLGNIDGTSEGFFDFPANTIPGSLVNHEGYSSDIVFSMNLAGAMGDSSWMDGNETAAFVGVHCTQDFFAPYSNGNVIVPTTGQFVVDVSGTRKAIELANDLGTNDGLMGLGANDDPLSDLIDEQKATLGIVSSATMPTQMILGTDNFYGFDIPITVSDEGVTQIQGSPWDWWGLDDLRNLVALVNAQNPTNEVDADELHASGLRFNPDMSAEKARTYIDTIFQLAIPRMYLAYDLGDAIVGTTDLIDAESIGLSAFPNPTTEILTIKTDGAMIEAINVLTQNGLLLNRINDINSQQYEWQRPAVVPSGPIFLQIQTDEGTTVQKVILQ